MAEVFLARTTVAQGLEKLLVIKKIHPAFAKSKHFVKMFVDEAKIALGLNHPNIVQVFDFGHVGQTYFLAMEHIEGADLLRLMQEAARQGKRIPYALCAYIVQQVAKGLDYAHRKTDEYGEPLGIVHRDISPQNVLISWDGAVKIVDFGIARARDIQEEEGVVKGKFAYMSPEQARGDPVDRRSDIFSAGIVLYELACARPLFAGKGKEVLEAVKAGVMPRPRDVDPELPPPLEEAVVRALAVSADERFQTARDLQNALGRVQFHLAQSEDDVTDSGTLAQFVAQTLPRERPQRFDAAARAAATPPPAPRRREGPAAGSLAGATPAAAAAAPLTPGPAATPRPSASAGARSSNPEAGAGASPSPASPAAPAAAKAAASGEPAAAPTAGRLAGTPAGIVSPPPRPAVATGTSPGAPGAPAASPPPGAVPSAAATPAPRAPTAPGAAGVARPPGTGAPPQAPVAALTPLPGGLEPAAAHPYESRERKHVIVLEGELTGLASLRQHAGEVRAREAVADFTRIAGDIAYKHDAIVHRLGEAEAAVSANAPGGAAARPAGATPGDRRPGLVLVIGLPGSAEDDAARAIRLALALVDALDGIGRDVEPELRLCVGIQRGVAVVRRRGARWDYELSDATSGIARRLAHEAQGGEVLVGGGVYRVARADWNFEELATIELPDDTSDTYPGAAEDGARRRARIYRLRGPREREQRMRDRAASTELVGRELELKTLRETYREVVLRRTKRNVLLVGDAGVGKRSLVSAFLRGLPEGEATVLRAAARAATAEVPYAIVADLARDLLRLAEGAAPREIWRRLEATTALLYPGEGDSREVTALNATMGMLLGARSEGARPAEVDPEERRHRIGDALLRLEERLSRDRPLVLVIEDAHWADSQSFEVFLERILEPGERAVFGLITTRPEERFLDAAARSPAILLTLDELGPEDAGRLVLSRFAPGEDAAELARQIVAKSGGNLFFLHEVLDSLVDRGIVAPSPAHPDKLVWVKRDAPLQVPVSVESLVATRIDRLPPAEKEVLTRAAVLGRELAAEDVAALVGRPVEVELTRLASRGLLVASPGGGHAFRNEMAMAVAYDLLPADERAALHRTAAERAAASPSFHEGPGDAAVARHLEAAGDKAGAARRYVAVARHALGVRANAEAMRTLERALQLLPASAHADRYDVHAERETVLRSWARRPQQRREIELMRREAESLDDPARVARALLRLSQFYLDVGKASAARRPLAPAREAARRSGQPLVEAEVHLGEATVSRSLSDFAGGDEHCGRALELCVQTDREGLLARAQILNVRGTCLWSMSRYKQAMDAYAEALVIYRRLQVPRQETRVLNNMGILFAAMGEFDQAITHYKWSLKIDTDLGDKPGLGLKLGNMGQAYLDMGALDKAEQCLTKSLALAEGQRDETTIMDATNTLGQVFLKRGETARARALFERGLDLSRQLGSRSQETRGLVYLALAALQAADPPERAIELARGAIRLGRALPMPIGEIYGLAVEALAHGKAGRPDEAYARAAEAVRLLEATKDPQGAEQIYYIHATVARGAGRPEEARLSLERAYRETQSRARRLRDPALRAQYLATPPARDILAEVARVRAGARE